MRSIFSITRNKLEEYFLENNEKKFKATQVFEWIYRKGVRSFDEMTNLKKETIDKYGYDPKTLTEDIEFTVLCALNDEKIAFSLYSSLFLRLLQ